MRYNLDTMGGSMHKVLCGGAVLALVLICLCPVPAYSVDVAGRSRTILTDRETVFEDNILRLYEYVDISAGEISDSRLSVHASGWGRYDFDTPEEGDRDEGDLSYAYLALPVDSIHSRLRIGRQYVYAGAAPEQMDGLYMTFNRSGFGAGLFAGSPPGLDDDDRSGDSMYGGRLSHQMAGLYEIGASYLKEQNDSDDFREEYGGDIWISPISWLSVQGRSLYNNETDGWAEHAYRITVSGTMVMVFGEYAALDYEHFFQASTTSAFSAALLTPDESYTSSGGGVTLLLPDGLQAAGRYKHYSYEQAGDADTYGGDISYAGDVISAGLSAGRTNGDTDEQKYDMYRAFVSATGETLDLTLDGVLVAYDVEINGTDQSAVATGALGYRPMKSLRIGIEGTYSETPQFENETRGLFKIDYRFGEI
jgi:hypothetical protein